MSKKLLYSLMAVLMVTIMVLSACGPKAEAPSLAVGIVLPTKDEPRWIQDETRFNDALTAAGYEVEILFSQGDSAKEKANVEALVTKGIKVLIICPQDGTAAAAAAEAARAAGVKVISYDRLIRDTDAVDYYVTFDSIAVGEAQAQYLVDKASGTDNPLFLYAGAASDNNAFLFFEGAWNVLQPKIADGTFVIKNSSEAIALQDKATLTRDEMAKIIGQVTTDWKFDVAKNLAEANLTAAPAADKGDVFILAPNDGTARSIADTFAADADVKSYVVTGQDAEEASVQYIIDGKQSMTVLKDVRTLVSDAIAAAVAYLEGKTPEKTTTYNNGKAEIPAKPSVVITVDQANVKAAVIDSGYWPAGDFTGLEGSAAPTTSQVEIFSWWVGGGEAAGLAAMQKVFEAKYPDITFVNAAVAGGSGTNARAVLATRLSAGDPPDSWQAHAGQEIIGTYVAANQIAPLDDFFTQTGFADVLPKTLIPLISKDGQPYSVPVNIHRSNVMWYNPTVLKDAGVVAVPTPMDEFFAACEKIKAAGKFCISVGPQWTAAHLWENVMIGTLGAEEWSGLWTGTTDWNSPDVTAALDNFAKVLSYANPDAASFTDWQPATKLVVDGDAAFNIMGDWADGYLENPDPDGLGLKAHTDFDWAPAPGTKGIFVFLSDSFVLPANAKNPDSTNAWLTVAASKEGQEAFNPVKGSICARTDCDQSLFNEYLQSAGKDWSTDTVVGSYWHGVVANDAWKTKIDTSFGLFLADPTKVADFQTALADACKSDGVCK
ncbi:MAG: extracellular solute-binding protein [Anaerolineales bacterium]|nr:extracellular solute-binding protein [Anaerolineales bacterium]